MGEGRHPIDLGGPVKKHRRDKTAIAPASRSRPAHDLDGGGGGLRSASGRAALEALRRILTRWDEGAAGGDNGTAPLRILIGGGA